MREHVGCKGAAGGDKGPCWDGMDIKSHGRARDAPIMASKERLQAKNLGEMGEDPDECSPSPPRSIIR